MNIFGDIPQKLFTVKIMGIINVTPDSFSDGGKCADISSILHIADDMVEAGAHVLDVGGESTRPGAEPVSLDKELHRVIPAIESLWKRFSHIPISIDTYKSAVARAALKSGASWVNDISGGTFSPDIFAIAAEFDATIIISHIKGTPRDMQKDPHYDNVVAEICEWLSERAQAATIAGIPKEKIIIDPGIGFGKKFEDNMTILHSLGTFKSLGYQLLVGASRKSFIGHYPGENDASRRDPGSYIAALWAVAHGADFLRVHDVRGTVQALKMAKAICEYQRNK